MNFLKRLFFGRKTDAPLIITAKIISIVKHHNSDHLNILSVYIGTNEPQQIVCGAPNVRVGLVGVLARPGAKLPCFPEPLSIREIRGIKSFGMMCSEQELGISDNHDGIIELPSNSKIGVKYERS
ncbi:MAG: hypothetical protein LBB23_04460 [Rickettsiales bacterium]|jgi:phenylalanyl-tRNA synthetase beta chain|nr:hypothetical protein [Rickettsiales bacterium]